MPKRKIFITSENFMIIFHEGNWTDGVIQFGSDHHGPKITGDIYVAGTFCEIDMLIDKDVDRYNSIVAMCEKELYSEK